MTQQSEFSRKGASGRFDRAMPRAALAVSALALIVAVSGGVGAFAAITTGQIANDAVTTAKIKNGEVKSADIENGGVKLADLAAGAVASSKIKAGAVTAPRLADGAVTADKLAPGAVGSLAVSTHPGSQSLVLEHGHVGAFSETCPEGKVLLRADWDYSGPPGGVITLEEEYDYESTSAGTYDLVVKNTEPIPAIVDVTLTCMVLAN